MTRHFIDTSRFTIDRFGNAPNNAQLVAISEGGFGVSGAGFAQSLPRLIETLRSSRSPEYAAIVRDVFVGLPISEDVPKSLELLSAVLDRRAFSEIAEAISDQKLKNNVTEDGELPVSRETLFGEKFETYLKLCKSAIVYDPYAATSLFSERSGRSWFFEKILQLGPETVTIHSFAPQFERKSLLDSASIDRLRRIIQIKLTQKDNMRPSLSLHLYEADTRKMHKRFIRLIFDRNCIDFVLDKGFDTFSPNAIAPSDVIELVRPQLTAYLHNLPVLRQTLSFA